MSAGDAGTDEANNMGKSKLSDANVYDVASHEKNPSGGRLRSIAGLTGVLADSKKLDIKGRGAVPERIPYGEIEEYIDQQGNFVWVQLIKPGTVPTRAQAESVRSKLSERGFVRASSCPVQADEDFRSKFGHLFTIEEMAPCQKPAKLHHCHHADVIAKSRRDEYLGPVKARRDARNAEANAKRAIEERRAIAAEQSAASMAALLEKLTADTADKRGKKGAGE